MSSVKRKLSVKSLGEKFQALTDLEKGLSKRNVAAKYGVSRDTISTWVKTNQSTLLHWNNHRIKEKKLRSRDYE